MPQKETLTIIIPSLNDEQTIEKIVHDSIKFSPIKSKVLVVLDSKTTDNTAALAQKAGAKVIHIGRGRGKGYAFRKAIPFVNTMYCVQIDSDYQFLPRDLNKILSPLKNGYDLTLGTRYQKGSRVQKGSVSPLKLFGSYLLSWTTSLAAMQRVTDVMAGYKGFKTASLKKMRLTTDHFGYEAELVIVAAKMNMRMINVPIGYRKRNFGRSNVSSIKHGFLVLQTIIKTRFF